jgi:transposase InsO family protein
MVEKMNRDHAVEISFGCEVLEMSRSGYYDWKDRPGSERTLENARLVEDIRRVHEQSRGIYGSPRVTEALKNDGKDCSEKRVARLMAENEIKSKTHKKFKICTTDSNHDLPIAPRIFETENAQAAVMAPDQIWVGDLTYIATAEGWLYLAIFMDLFTRKIVGFSLADHMRTEMVLQALQMGIGRQNVEPGTLIVHSDRGVQYAASEFRDKLSKEDFIASMSRKGNCWDNAFAESFFRSLKVELVYQTEFATRKQAERAIFEYIEVFLQEIHTKGASKEGLS